MIYNELSRQFRLEKIRAITRALIWIFSIFKLVGGITSALGWTSTGGYLHLSIFLYDYSRNHKIIVEELQTKIWSNGNELNILSSPCYFRVFEMPKIYTWTYSLGTLIIDDLFSHFTQERTEARDKTCPKSKNLWRINPGLQSESIVH